MFHTIRVALVLWLLVITLSIILFSVTRAALPPFSFGSLRSLFYGTYSVCQSYYPSCEAHLNISPKCERQENPNKCNCQCIIYKNLKAYHEQ